MNGPQSSSWWFGKVFDADYHQQWLTSLQAEDPDAPDGQKYGYGISYQRFGPNAAMYYHGGELPGFNSFMGYDPDSDVALVIWTNLDVLQPERVVDPQRGREPLFRAPLTLSAVRSPNDEMRRTGFPRLRGLLGASRDGTRPSNLAEITAD